MLHNSHRHYDDQTSGNVRMEHVVTQPPLEFEYELQTCEISCQLVFFIADNKVGLANIE